MIANLFSCNNLSQILVTFVSEFFVSVLAAFRNFFDILVILKKIFGISNSNA
jgi:hypothetical protein